MHASPTCVIYRQSRAQFKYHWARLGLTAQVIWYICVGLVDLLRELLRSLHRSGEPWREQWKALEPWSVYLGTSPEAFRASVVDGL